MDQMSGNGGSTAEPVFFETPGELRAWFEQHHAAEPELHVGFYKKGSGRPSVTWPEAVDEALCFGWIDGVRRNAGPESYAIRFTPRRAVSTWSAVNIARVAVLTAEGRMQAAGLAAFARRREERSRIYAYEQPGAREKLAARPAELVEPYAGQMQRQAPAAWAHFTAQTPSARRKWAQWIADAKAEPTRQRRLEKLIATCAEGKKL